MSKGRSYLYIPAIKEKYYEKIDSNNADAIIFDLEDSVKYENKEEARELLQKFFNKDTLTSKEIFVRINSEPKLNEKDAKLINKYYKKIKGVFLPKVKRSEEIDIVDKAIGEGGVEIVPLIETPEAVLNLENISMNEKVTTVALGEVDLSRSLNINPSNGLKQLIPIRLFVNLVLAANKKKPPIGPVWTNIDDEKGLKDHMEMIRNLGYSGVQLIHPNQIEITNEIFSHSEDEITWARSILELSNELESNSGSFKDINNEMIDEAVIKRARIIIESIEDDLNKP